MSRTNLRKVIFLNCVLAIFQSSVNACLNIVGQIYDQNGYKYLGNVSVILIFGIGMIGNFIAVLYIKKLQYRYMLFIHALSYLLFVSQGIMISYCYDHPEYVTGMCSKSLTWFLVILGSSITGFMAAGLWICQNDYISEASTPQNVGLFYGIGWALVQSSILIGSVYSGYVIESFGQFKFFCVMFAIGFISSFVFLLVPQPKLTNKVVEHFQQNDETESSVINQSNKSNQYTSEQYYKLPLRVQLLELYNYMKQPKVMLINFPIMITGIILSFTYNIMHVLIENTIDLTQDKEEVNALTFRVMISLGIMEIMGGLGTGYLNNRFNKVSVLIFLNLLLQSALVLGLIDYYEKSYGLCFVIAGIWGFIDCGTTSSMLALLSEHFGDDVRIYCNFNFFQCLGGIIGTLISIVMKDYELSWILLLILGFQVMANMLLQIWSVQYKTKEASELKSD